MRVYFDPKQLNHDPRLVIHNGKVAPFAEIPERAVVILDRLRLVGYPILQPQPVDYKILQQVHDDVYLEFLKQTTDIKDTDLLVPDTFPDDYRLKLKVPELYNHCGAFALDCSSPISNRTFESALASAGAAYSAALCVLNGEESVAYALCRPPGHHASTLRYGGSCFINTAAIAAFTFIDKGYQVLIIDIDDHHGSGTQFLTYDKSNPALISIHASPSYEYPYYSGFKDEKGIDQGLGYNINLPYDKDCTPEQWYNSITTAVIKYLPKFKPDVLIISLGTDSEPNDPEGGEVGLMPEDFNKIGKFFESLDLPTVIVQEGGYNLMNLDENVYSFLKAWDDVK
jgi:acetoin utilization deacetylase AcuC-like enzyme